MNEFGYFIMGIMILIVSVMMGIMTSFNLLPPMIYIIVSIIIGAVAGLFIALTSLLLKGIMSPMMSARIGGKTLVAILTANKNIDLESGYENDGIVDTRRGSFIVPTDTVYSWPNGVRSGLAFYKYGVTLKPDHIKACSVLKKNDINDINQLEKANELVEKAGKKMMLRTGEVT